MFRAASKILNNAVNGFIASSEAKQKIKAARAEAEAKVYVNAAESVTEWERIMAQNSAGSWKDEYLTVFTTLLALGLGVGYCLGYEAEADRVIAGFFGSETISLLLLIVYSGSFGIRAIPKLGGVLERLVKK